MKVRLACLASALALSPFAYSQTARADSLVIQNTGLLGRTASTSYSHVTIDGPILVASQPQVAGEFPSVAVYDVRTGRRTVIAQNGGPALYPHNRTGKLVLAVGFENYMGDLNGDGDDADRCSLVFDATDGSLYPANAIQPFTPTAGHGQACIALSEPGEQRDLNGDGDEEDFVGAVWRRGQSFILPGVASAEVRPGQGMFVLTTAEYAEEQDLKVTETRPTSCTRSTTWDWV